MKPRPTLIGDITTTARALLNAPRNKRPSMADQWVSMAADADAYRLETGEVPINGNGSLMSLVMTHCERLTGKPLPGARYYDDPEYNLCMQIALDAVARHVERMQDKGEAA